METYQNWKRKNSLARITMLSSMTSALMCEYEEFDIAQDICIVLKDKFGGTYTTKLRRLTIKFDTYMKRQNHDMRQQLREMSNMIRELKSAGHSLIDEQQIQAVIRSLPNSWENMKINMTHNDNIKNFDDISRHVELEDERLEAAKAFGQLYMVESRKRKTKSFMRKGKKGNFQKGKWKGPKKNFKKSENSDGSVTEIESRDVNFLESEFPKRGEVERDIRFYELDNLIEDSNLNAPLKVNTDLSGPSVPSGSKTPIQVNIYLPGPSVPNGSNEVVETTLLDLPSHRSNRGNVPHRRFEIEGEAFMVASHDADEPKNVNEALKSPDKELWIKAMKEEMDSMKSNHVWDLVDLPSGRKASGNK
ncbi:hypothetical protein LWI28_007482 [Acer negundo]|uniref:Uncharacterized protein n=1 Tax=Acer negundo TaxID=4023 RepID=A0AAD5IM80_ACENE|nr:hypothetical protein LWI28_007482 [Acer negundo]